MGGPAGMAWSSPFRARHGTTPCPCQAMPTYMPHQQPRHKPTGLFQAGLVQNSTALRACPGSPKPANTNTTSTSNFTNLNMTYRIITSHFTIRNSESTNQITEHNRSVDYVNITDK
jgi:hypothetical protein